MKPSFGRHSFILPIAAFAALSIAACAGGGAGWTYAPAQPTPTSAAGSPGPSGSGSASQSPAASGSGAPSASPSGPVPGSPSAGASPGASGGGATGQTIELEETADLHIVQNGQPVASLAVKPGETVTFKITNSAGYDHDFYIGPPDKLSGNDVTGLTGLAPFQTGTQEFTYTVPADVTNLEFACTLPGHYPSMHGPLTAAP